MGVDLLERLPELVSDSKNPNLLMVSYHVHKGFENHPAHHRQRLSLDRTEAIRKFATDNLKYIAADPFPKQLYKAAKHDYFLVQLKNSVGVPKDSDIAHESMMLLLDRGSIKDGQMLDSFLSRSFFNQHIREAEYYVEYLNVYVLGKSNVPLDLGKIAEDGYRRHVEEEVKKKVLEEKSQEIQQAIDEKKKQYDALPSVLDQYEYQEPEFPQIPEEDSEYLLWWKRLGLVDDPFPSEEGLARIANELYEKVVYKADIIKRYLYYVQEAPSELFKNTIFFGEFGSGKTTLFEYLRMHLISAGLRSLYVQLYGEPDTYSLRMRFEKKLFDALCDLYESLKGSSPRGLDPSAPLDESIVELMTELKGDFIIFVDDLHKDRDNFRVAMNFVSMLQTFTADLMRAHPSINVGFYFAGSLEWEREIKRDVARYSGSFSRQETMPPLTPEAAKEMLDLRLAAFQLNPEGSRSVAIDRIRQIYRSLQHNHLPITYRQFIHTIVSEFREGRFDVLEASPIRIPKEKLDEIKNLIESDSRLKSYFDKLIYGGGIQTAENKRKCIEVLVKVYLERGYGEDSPYFKQNPFFFQRLQKSGLIQKMKFDDTRYRWVVCTELREATKKIREEFNLSPEDYLPKLYAARPPRAVARETVSEEIKQIRAFLDSASPAEVRTFLDESIQLHQQILTEQEKLPDKQADPQELIQKCRTSLVFLSKAALASQGIDLGTRDDAEVLSWWKRSWHPLEEVSEFLAVAGSSERDASERAAYACSIYRQAYQGIFNFVKDQCDKTRYLRIVPTDLTNAEIREFNDIRDLLASQEYFQAGDRTATLVERKLRLFMFNIFRLLYGEKRESRLRCVDDKTRTYILENISKDADKGFAVPKNEFEQLNRNHYKGIILPSGGSIASQNWSEVFSHVFSPLTVLDVEDFLNKFADISIRIGHMKEGSIRAQQQERIFDFARRSQEIVQTLNRAYCTLVRTGIYRGTEKGELYFSFSGLKDKTHLKPIIVSSETAQRLDEKLSMKTEMEVDLEDWEHIEHYYGVEYPVLVGCLARSITQTPHELARTKRRVMIRGAMGCIITLSIERLMLIQTKEGPKLLSDEELPEYLGRGRGGPRIENNGSPS